MWQGRKVIESLGRGDWQTETSVDGREPAFFVPEIRSLKLRSTLRGGETPRFLAQHTARNPTDLKSQVQRVHLHLAEGDAERMYGALVDLFITLGDRGGALRRRMLAACKSSLGLLRYQALAAKLDQGLSFSDPIPLATEARLSKGITGSCRLVERTAAVEGEPLEVLDEVRSYLEYGQLEEARETLEAAVLEAPWRAELHAELLGLYRVTGEWKRFEAMGELLEAADNPCVEKWRSLAEKRWIDAEEGADCRLVKTDIPDKNSVTSF